MIANELKQLGAYAPNTQITDRALNSEYNFRVKSNEEIRGLLDDIQKLYEKNKMVELGKLSDNLDREIEREVKIISNFNNAVQEFNKIDPNIVSFPLKTNKMVDILNGAKDLLKSHLEDLLAGRLPANYELSDRLQPFKNSIDGSLRDKDTIYGNSKASFLKVALLELKNQLLPKTEKLFSSNVLDQSAIAHIVPIPDQMSTKNLQDSKYYYSDDKTPQGLVTVHSGYAFGGHREQLRYPVGKEYGPEDCSSWVAKITGHKDEFSTLHQYAAYNISRDKTCDISKLSNIEQDIINRLTEKYEAVEIHDPQQDIQPGQVYFRRGFKESDDPNGLGSFGHTAIVIGKNDEGIVSVINVNRNMPDIEGYYISQESFKDYETFTGNNEKINWKVGFLNVKPEENNIYMINSRNKVIAHVINDDRQAKINIVA